MLNPCRFVFSAYEDTNEREHDRRSKCERSVGPPNAIRRPQPKQKNQRSERYAARHQLEQRLIP